MFKNNTKKMYKALELYNLVYENEKAINIIDKQKIINDYKLINFDNNKIIDKFIILISEKLGENMPILLKIYEDIRKSSICVKVLGEVKEPTFTEELESYYLPKCKEAAGILRTLVTISTILGVYELLYEFFSLTLGSLSYVIMFCQFFSLISRSVIGKYISKIDIKKILEYIAFRANIYFEEQGKLYVATHEHIKVQEIKR